MAEGNPKEYNPNSHTSIMTFHGISGTQEDKHNKWEYDVDKKELQPDTISTTNDKDLVKPAVEAWLAGKNIPFLRNFYGMNSGYLNSGYRNSGDRNSGDRNSGDRNSGDRNSGDLNSGYLNSGYLNSGDRNSGYLNSNEPTVRMFNKDTKKTFAQINIPGFMFNLAVTHWTAFSDMTDAEKIAYPQAYVCDGYLKKIDYKEAWANLWAKATDAEKASVKKLPNFSAKVFFEITGIKIEKKKAKK